MVSKIISITAIVLLVLLPYSTVLSMFSPYLTAQPFSHFLVASIVFAIVSLLLGLVASAGTLFKKTGFLFFLLGMVVAPPFMIGTPETSPKLLERVSEEHFRYGLLILSTLVFAIGFLSVIKGLWKDLSVFNKLVIIPFAVSVVLMLWDNYSSYHFSAELKDWIAAGSRAEDFFPDYNFHHFLRTFGRSLLYILIPWLSYILLGKQEVKKWQAIVLSVFCAVGIICFLLCNAVGLQFYFPFMVPAIALAPAYWLGLMLITRKPSKERRSKY